MRNEIKNLLNKYGLRPKKSLGQNFLINPKVYESIISAAQLESGDKVIEVGPGLGTLTKYILKTIGSSRKLIAIEKDEEFVNILKGEFKESKNVKIVEGDILLVDPKKYKIPDDKYKILGNIPYYLTSRLLRTIFQKWPRPELIVLMVQEELAKRIIAKPPRSNLLAISVQYFSKPEIIKKVSKKSFWPEPKVDSTIIRLTPTDTRPSPNRGRFFKVVRAGFSENRKQLINSLSHGLSESKGKIEKILKSSGINPTRRAETLTLPEWKKITKIYSTLE